MKKIILSSITIKNLLMSGITIIGIGVILFSAYILYMVVTDYRPADVIPLETENNKKELLKKEKSISISTFNIGYCGLDKEQDFFMDGGKGSGSSSKEKTVDNLSKITEFLKGVKSDFLFLQEVDITATRSFHVNELEYLKEKIEGYGSTFATNYKVAWVPVPIFKPMGSVNGGMVTFSKYKIDSANRYKYPGEEQWFIQLAELDRCMIETRLKVEDGKELVLINSHLSAFDKGGKIRKQQLAFLKEHIQKEYSKGNYVIVGGDWNHLIPGTDPLIFKTTQQWPSFLQKIPEDFKPEGFQWVADKEIPTVRTNGAPYEPGVNFLAVIDGFLVSPNIGVQKIEGYSLEFENSDHNPVTMEFKLK